MGKIAGSGKATGEVIVSPRTINRISRLEGSEKIGDTMVRGGTGMRKRAGSMDTVMSKKSNSTNNSKGNSALFQNSSKKNGSKSSPARNDHRGRPQQQHHRRRSLSPLACSVRSGKPGSISRCKTPTSTAAVHPNLYDSDRCHRGDNASQGSSLSTHDQFDIYVPGILPGSRLQNYGTNITNKHAQDDISSITTNEYLKYGGILSHVSHWISRACDQSCHGSTPVEEEEALLAHDQVTTTPVYQPKKQQSITTKKNLAPSKEINMNSPAPLPLPTSSGQVAAEGSTAVVSCLPFDLCIMSVNKTDADTATVDTTKGSHETASSHNDIALARNASLFDDALEEDENQQKRLQQ